MRCSPRSARRWSSILQRRSTCGSRSPIRSRTPRQTSSAHSACSRLRGHKAPTSSSPPPAARSTASAMGRQPRTRSGLPLSPYGTSKLAAEEYLSTWNRLYGTGHVALRLGNIYGPRQDPHGEAGVVSIFLQRLREGAAGNDLRRWITDPRLRLRGRRRPRDARSAGGGGRGVQHRQRVWRRPSTSCGTPAAARPAQRRPPPSAPSLASGRSSAASSIRPRQGTHSVGGPPRRSTMGFGRPGSGSGRNEARAVESGRAVSHPLSLPRIDLPVRQWRLAAIVLTCVAAVELVLLVAVGGALLSRPESRASATPKRAVAATVKVQQAKSTPATQAALPRRRIGVLVLNGNGRTGAASVAANRVTQRGYRVRGVANAPSAGYARSIVMYRPGFKAEGARLARDLGVAHRRPARRHAPVPAQRGAHGSDPRRIARASTRKRSAWD